MKFYQVCYGKPNNAWGLFNMSENSDVSVTSFFEKVAKSKAPDCIKNATADTIGFQLFAGEGLVTFTKIKYGLTDSFGRASMFAQGFVFDVKSGCVEDANALVGISDSNFSFSEVDTRDIPNELVYDAPFNVTSAKQILGINDETVFNIMGCVYRSINSKTTYDTYLVFKGDETQKKALVYLILSMLPYSMRCNISISDIENSQRQSTKSFIIVDSVPEENYYINVNSDNDTNIDLETISDNPEEYISLQELVNTSPEKFQEKCEVIKKAQIEYGFPYNCSYNELKLLTGIMQNKNKVTKNLKELNDNKFAKYIATFLKQANNGYLGNIFVDEYVTELILEYSHRGIMPNEEITMLLEQRNDRTKHEELKKAIKQYQMVELVSNGDSFVIEFIGKKHKEGFDVLSEYSNYIIAIGKGDCLIEYYVQFINSSNSMQVVKDCFSECKSLKIYNNAIGSCIKQRLHKIALKNIKDDIYRHNSTEEIFEQYTQIYNSIFGEDKDSTKIFKRISDDFWADFEVEQFDFNKEYITNIKQLIDDKTSVDKTVGYLIQLSEIVNFNYKDDYEYRANIENMLLKMQESDFENKVLIEKISNYILEELSKYRDGHIMFWYQLAKLGVKKENRYEIIEKMLEWKLEVLVSRQAFEECLQSPRTEENISKLIGAMCKQNFGYLGHCTIKDDNYKLIKNRLSLLEKKNNEISKRAKKSSKQVKKEKNNENVDEMAVNSVEDTKSDEEIAMEAIENRVFDDSNDEHEGENKISFENSKLSGLLGNIKKLPNNLKNKWSKK